jgi:hypothetical protein
MRLRPRRADPPRSAASWPLGITSPFRIRESRITGPGPSPELQQPRHRRSVSPLAGPLQRRPARPVHRAMVCTRRLRPRPSRLGPAPCSSAPAMTPASRQPAAKTAPATSQPHPSPSNTLGAAPSRRRTAHGSGRQPGGTLSSRAASRCPLQHARYSPAHSPSCHTALPVLRVASRPHERASLRAVSGAKNRHAESASSRSE